MRRFIAVLIFFNAFVLCNVATAYADQLPEEVRVDMAIKSPAELAPFVMVDRPVTDAVRIEDAELVLTGALIAPEQHCNSPGNRGKEFTVPPAIHYLFDYGLRH